MSFGDIRFTPVLDTKHFDRDLKRLKSDGERVGLEFAKGFDKNVKKIKFGTLKSDLKNFANGVKASNEQLAKATNQAIETRNAYKGLVAEYEAFKKSASDKFTQKYSPLASKAESLKKQIEAEKTFAEATRNMGSTIDMGAKLRDLEAELSKTTAEMKELSDSGWDREDVATADAYKEKIKEAGVAMLTADKIADSMNRGANTRKFFGGLFSKVGAVGAGLFSGLKKSVSALGTAFQKTTQHSSGLLSKLLKFGSIALIVRKAYQYMQEGLSNLTKADSRTANSVSQLKGALTGLKNALGSAFAPIVNSVTPILVKFINMLTRAANAVAMFIATLTGQDYVVQAVEGVSEGVSGIGDSASGANKSAKELERTLMGFDKINKLDALNDTGSGGSGGSSGSGAGTGFTTVPIDSAMSTWVEKFKKSWEDADFYWLGELLAEKLNNALANIPWEKIQNNARKLASSLATFLNGFIENANWNLVGETIAQALNTAVYFAQTFVTKFNWAALGTAIANTINGFVEKTDWGAIGDTIGKSITGLLTTISNFLRKTDWGAIGEAIVETIANIDWWGIITGAVTVAVDIANALYDLVKGALGSLKDKITKWFDTHDIFEEISKLTEKEQEIKLSLHFYDDLPPWAQKIWEILEDFAIKKNPVVVNLSIVLKIVEWVKSVIEFLSGNKLDKEAVLTVDGTKTSGFTSAKNEYDSVKTNTATKQYNHKWLNWDSFKSNRTTFNDVKTNTATKQYNHKWLNWGQWKDARNVFNGLKTNTATKQINAKYTNWSNNWKPVKKEYDSFKDKTVTVGVKANINRNVRANGNGKLAGGGLVLEYAAKGGIFKNGKWSPIQNYASGGSPNMGQMFIAREAGPELVGTLGGHTAVMNNDQIVASVSAGVARAIAGIRFKLQGATPQVIVNPFGYQNQSQVNNDNADVVKLLQELISTVRSKDSNVYLDGRELYTNTIERINNETRRTGVSPILI